MFFRSCRIFAVVVALGGLLIATAWAQGGAAVQPAQSQRKAQSIGEKIAASKELLDINTATEGELKGLPGMGAVYAQRVIAGRPYSAKSQLVQRGILPEDEYLRIKEYIIAHRVKK